MLFVFVKFHASVYWVAVRDWQRIQCTCLVVFLFGFRVSMIVFVDHQVCERGPRWVFRW